MRGRGREREGVRSRGVNERERRKGGVRGGVNEREGEEGRG